ncbi:MAG TPA: hypothetical protein VMH79_11590 [Thermoanaerobaculia bacterium]|nr:hypothetical protein [Thermoanaerobaculia bacterium]
MIEPTTPTVWTLACPDCGECVTLEFPSDAEPGVGVETCRAGHDFPFQYDGLTVEVLGVSSRY